MRKYIQIPSQSEEREKIPFRTQRKKTCVYLSRTKQTIEKKTKNTGLTSNMDPFFLSGNSCVPGWCLESLGEQIQSCRGCEHTSKILSNEKTWQHIRCSALQLSNTRSFPCNKIRPRLDSHYATVCYLPLLMMSQPDTCVRWNKGFFCSRVGKFQVQKTCDISV